VRALLIVLAAGAATYALRIAMPMVLGRRTAPAWLQRTSPYVLPAAFAAMVATAVSGPEQLLAVGAAAGVAARTRSSVTAIAVGLPALWLAQVVVP
jgi:branched-subunit amino acid transport protein